MNPASIQDPSPAASQRGQLHQLATAGSVRLILGFSESREYVDSVPSLTRVPRAPAWLLGAFSADGTAVPLVDLEAWALRAAPRPWSRAREAGALTPLHAMRIGDGADAWAIRLSHSPSVVDLAQAQGRPIGLDLPLDVSASNGSLMPHAAKAWFLADQTVALQIHWALLMQALRQELSGVPAA